MAKKNNKETQSSPSGGGGGERNKKGDYNKFWPKDKKKIPPQHTCTQKMKKKAAWFY